MELSAAVLAARLAQSIKTELRLKSDQETYWSDSSTVLCWIYSTYCRYHTWVANRVGEILTLTTPKQWWHVPGSKNPADDCSRGVEATSLTESNRWWAGPDFLRLPKATGPAMPEYFEQPNEDPEVKPPKWVGAIAEPPPHPLSSLVLRTSNICKTKRIISWILRYIHNRFPQGAEKRCSPFPLISKMREAEIILNQIAQRECYRKEFRRFEKGKELKPDSSLITLTPFVDSEAKLTSAAVWVIVTSRKTTSIPFYLH